MVVGAVDTLVGNRGHGGRREVRDRDDLAMSRECSPYLEADARSHAEEEGVSGA